MRKTGKGLILAGILSAVLLSGCTNYEDLGKNIIKINDNGSVEETLQESFDTSRYQQADLITSIEEEVAAYNSGSDNALVTFDECELKESKVDKGSNDASEENASEPTVVVRMTYASAADYTAFNHVKLFHGTMDEFVETDYHAYVDLKDTEGNEIPLSSVVASGEEFYVLAMDFTGVVQVDGTICYMSEGVEALSKKAADVTLGESSLAYIVYQK